MSKSDIFYVPNQLYGYKNSASEELEKALREIGLNKQTPDGLGAGPSPEQIIAFISSHNEFFIGIASNLVSSRLEKLASVIFNWHKKNKKLALRKYMPVVEIWLYKNSSKKDAYLIKLRADRKYTIDELKNLIKDSTKKSN